MKPSPDPNAGKKLYESQTKHLKNLNQPHEAQRKNPPEKTKQKKKLSLLLKYPGLAEIAPGNDCF